MLLSGSIQMRQHLLASRAPLADRGDLLGQVLDPRATCLALGGIALVQTLEVIVELGVGKSDELSQRCAGEVAVFVVDRLDPRAVYRDQLPAKQVQLAAEQHKLAEDWAEGASVIASEIGDGLEVGFQMSQQPDHFDVAMGLGFEPATRPHAI